MSLETMNKDLEDHPDLIPMFEENPDGTIVCIGWASPIRFFPGGIAQDLEYFDEGDE